MNPESWNMVFGGIPILYLKAMRILMFQLSPKGPST